MADIERIGANDILECNCCCLGSCEVGMSTEVAAVIVTLKEERARLYKWCGRQFIFNFVANPDEFVKAVKRQMAALGNAA